MTEQEKIELVARALCADAGSKCECKVPCPPCMQDAKTSFAVLRPIIREEALEEAEDTINEVGDHADANAYLNAIRELKEKS